MFEFGALPPEINSTRMYAGPGSGPMMAASTAWSAVAWQLESVAASYSSVISSLSGQQWSGPASAAMAAAATRYMAWASATAEQAEHSAVQIRVAAAAYETAFAATVPPAAVAANRAQLAMLVVTNFFGQNAPAIAATEMLYGEMWAQDATAMYGYAAAAAEATTLTPFQPAPETTDPGGQSAQQAAVVRTIASSTADNAQTTLSRILSAVPQRLDALTTPQPLSAAPAGAAAEVTPASPLSPILGPVAAFDSLLTLLRQPLMQTVQTTGSQGIFGVALHDAERKLGDAVRPPPVVIVSANETAAPGVRGAAAAGAGKAASVGKLSVPQRWSTLAQAAHPAAAQPPQPGAVRAAPAEAVNAPKSMSGTPPMAMMGPMENAAQRAGGTPVFRMRDRRFRMPRPPAAG